MVSHNNRCGARTNSGRRCKKAINHEDCVKRGLSTTRFCTQHWKEIADTDDTFMELLDYLYSDYCPGTVGGAAILKTKVAAKKALRFTILNEASYSSVPITHFNEGIIEGLKPLVASQPTE